MKQKDQHGAKDEKRTQPIRKALFELVRELLGIVKFVHKIPLVDNISSSTKIINTRKVTSIANHLQIYLFGTLTMYEMSDSAIQSMDEDFQGNYEIIEIEPFSGLY